MVTIIGSSSVCCPSRGHISKTKQDTPVVTMEHCQEVGIADSFAAFRSSRDALLGRCLGFRYKLCTYINTTASCLTWRQTTAVVNQA